MIKETVITASITIGDTVYLTGKDRLLHDERRYSITKTIVTDVSRKHGFTLDTDINFRGTPEENDMFRAWEQIGKDVFLSREAAVQSLQENKDFCGYVYEDDTLDNPSKFKVVVA